MDGLIYFDNAATTFPKPRPVTDAVRECITKFCANPGRSSHHLALKAAEQVYLCREKIAAMLGGEPENAVFTLSATHSINLALKSILKAGDHVLISDIEHNATLRPIAEMVKKGFISYDVYRADLDTDSLLSELKSKVKANTALICSCHRSNICQITANITDIGAFCRANGIIFLVDASQSAGTIVSDVKKQNIDVLCAPAHKGLYGIPGCGFAVFGERIAKSGLLNTFIEGGNGVDSLESYMPSELPERLEAGTLPLPAICALSAGIDTVNGIGIGNIKRHEDRLSAIASERLAKLKRVKLHSDKGTILFSVDGATSEDFASELAKFGVCVRAGLHCAPLAHKRLGTLPDGGIRLSFGISNTENQVEEFIKICKFLL